MEVSPHGIRTERRLEKSTLPAAQELTLALEYVWKLPAHDVAGVRHPAILEVLFLPIQQHDHQAREPCGEWYLFYPSH